MCEDDDLRVDSAIDLLYKDSMHILDEVDNNAYVKPEYIACKEIAWLPLVHQVSTQESQDSNAMMAAGAFDTVVAEDAGAAPARPAEVPRRPKRGMALSNDESAASR